MSLQQVAVGASTPFMVPDEDTTEAFRVMWDYLAIRDEPRRSDVIFCFGSRDRRVPKHAAELYACGAAPRVVVSGGALLDGERREADVFAADLLDLGVPADRIFTERRARNTGQNVELGVEAAAAHGPVERIIAVSWPLMARRCRATFARIHPSLAVVSAPAVQSCDEYSPPPPHMVRFALGEWDRLASYAALGYLVRQPRPAAARRAAGVLRYALTGEPGGVAGRTGALGW